MKSKAQIHARLDEIDVEAKRFVNTPVSQLSDKQIAYVNRLASEEEALKSQLDVHKRVEGPPQFWLTRFETSEFCCPTRGVQ